MTDSPQIDLEDSPTMPVLRADRNHASKVPDVTTGSPQTDLEDNTMLGNPHEDRNVRLAASGGTEPLRP